MKTGLLFASAVMLCALASGCSTVNMARRGCDSCTSKAGGVPCSCAAAASAGAVSPAVPPAVAGTPVDPGAVASAVPYDPGMGGYGGYGGGYGGRGGHFHHGRGGYPNDVYSPGPPSAHVAYPYYTTRGPRDFLLNNPPSIGY